MQLKFFVKKSSFFSYNQLTVKLKGVLIGYTFAMVAYCVELLTISCSPMFGIFGIPLLL